MSYQKRSSTEREPSSYEALVVGAFVALVGAGVVLAVCELAYFTGRTFGCV